MLHREEPSMNELMEQVGYCLRSWSFVELEMTRLFLSVHDVQWKNALQIPKLRAAYECVTSLEVRLAMLTKSIEVDVKLIGKPQTSWNAIHNKIKRLANKRAQVAHFMAGTHDPLDSPNKRFMIFPFYSVTSQLTGEAAAPLSAKQLCARAEAFRLLAKRITRFQIWVEIQRGREPASRSPEADLDRLLDNPNGQTSKGT